MRNSEVEHHPMVLAWVGATRIANEQEMNPFAPLNEQTSKLEVSNVQPVRLFLFPERGICRS